MAIPKSDANIFQFELQTLFNIAELTLSHKRFMCKYWEVIFVELISLICLPSVVLILIMQYLIILEMQREKKTFGWYLKIMLLLSFMKASLQENSRS